MTLELSSHVNWSLQARYLTPSRLTVMSRTPLEGGDPNIGLSSVPCQGLFSDMFSPSSLHDEGEKDAGKEGGRLGMKQWFLSTISRP